MFCAHTHVSVLHLISDNIIFNLTNHNDFLQCEVNVSRTPGFVLSIFYNGCMMQTVGSVRRDSVTTLPYATLSKSASLRGDGKYECQLHLKGDVITKSVFNYHLTGNNFHRDLMFALNSAMLSVYSEQLDCVRKTNSQVDTWKFFCKLSVKEI